MSVISNSIKKVKIYLKKIMLFLQNLILNKFLNSITVKYLNFPTKRNPKM